MAHDSHRCTLTIKPIADQGAWMLYSADLSGPGSFNFNLQFRVPASLAHLVSERADPFVLASLFHCQYQNLALRVEGAPVSRGLISGLREFQDAWARWRDNLQVIDINAEEESAPRENRLGTLSLFSGGVDSAYTAFQGDTLSGTIPNPTLRADAGLFVHGFDIPLSDSSGFEAARKRGEAMLSDLGMPLYALQVNLREMGYDWEDSHGLACAAALTLFSHGFNCGLIPASTTYELPFLTIGSNPLTDPLLGSDYFRIRHHGATASRLQKVGSLQPWVAGMKGLRFCWLGEQHDTNCGRCEKCILTALEISVLGGEPRCFDTPVTEAAIMDVLEDYSPDPVGDLCFADVLAAARERGLNGPVYEAIDAALQGAANPASAGKRVSRRSHESKPLALWRRLAPW